MAFEGQKQPRLTGYLRVFGNLSDPKEVEDDSQVSVLNKEIWSSLLKVNVLYVFEKVLT